jgi:hypothetical protein
MSKRYELEPGVVDLDTTEEYDAKGNRIDSAYVDRVVDDVHAKLRAGRLRSRAPVPTPPSCPSAFPNSSGLRPSSGRPGRGSPCPASRKALERLLAS